MRDNWTRVMVFWAYSSFTAGSLDRPRAVRLILLALVVLGGAQLLKGQLSVSAPDKRIIGATATISEASTGIAFPARIDTGANSCSLHVEELEIIDQVPGRRANIGKKIRFRIQGEDGQSKWIETRIADAVRIRSGVFKDGEFDRRYMVRLTLQWQDVSKEVLVTLNDRTDMTYPLLIGRNFLHGDFLVDVAKNDVAP
jgi:hypothetical protein